MGPHIAELCPIEHNLTMSVHIGVNTIWSKLLQISYAIGTEHHISALLEVKMRITHFSCLLIFELQSYGPLTEPYVVCPL